MTDEGFSRRYEAFEREGIEAFLVRFSATSGELRQAIEYLIRERERLRDEELALLEREAGRLAQALQGVDQAKLLKELECFRDVVALHRRMLEKHDKP